MIYNFNYYWKKDKILPFFSFFTFTKYYKNTTHYSNYVFTNPSPNVLMAGQGIFTAADMSAWWEAAT